MVQKAKTSLLASSTILAGFLIGCGGGGGGVSTGGGNLNCGFNFATPNYVQDTDPASGDQNVTRFWKTFPITLGFKNEVSYNDSGTTVTTSDQTRVAMDRWVNAADGTALFNEISNANNAKIQVEVNQLSAEPGAGGTLAQTLITYYPSSGEIIRAEITLNTWPGMTRNQFVNGLKRTMAHEFGHALYLEGHSETLTDVMYYQGNPSLDQQLTTRDINSLQTAYCGDYSNRSVRTNENETPAVIVIECPK